MTNDFAQKFEDAINDDMWGASLRYASADLLQDGLRLNHLTAAEAVPLIVRIRGHREFSDKVIEKCLAALPTYHCDAELAIALMNNPRLFHMLSDYSRWKIREQVTQDPELMKKVGVGWVGGRHAKDFETLIWLGQVAVFTHALECIQESGDAHAITADEYLYNRISKGLGAEEKTSHKTAEFLAGCHALALEGMSVERRVQMASEMIIMLVGHQSRESREVGLDVSIRLRDQKLKTLNYLQSIITDAMTVENAGVILRWAMARHRHHQWFWQRLTNKVKSCQWNMGKVVKVDGWKLGTVRHAGSRKFIVIVTENNGGFGDIKVDQTVMIPPHRILGKPVQEDGHQVVYQGNLQPILPPTKAMRDAVAS